MITDKSKGLVILFVFVVVASAIFYFGVIKQWKPSVSEKSPEIPKVSNDGVVRPSKEFLEKATQKSYDELKQESPNVVTSPNIYDPETKKQFEEIAKSQNPENYFVIYDGKTFEPSSITIFQGDLVTWRNNAVSNLQVKGKGDWGSLLPIETGKAFSQQFDYLGTYKYTVEANDKILGEVIVVAR